MRGDFAIDRERWARMTIHEQMGNIGSEVERAFAAKRRRSPELLEGAVYRARDLFDATVEILVRSRSHRTREVLRARDQFLTAVYNDDTPQEEMDSLARYFMFYALAARRDR